MLPEWLIRAVVGVCGRDLHTNTNLKGLKMSLFYDAFLSFSSQIRGQETITRPKNEDELASSVLERLQPPVVSAAGAENSRQRERHAGLCHRHHPRGGTALPAGGAAATHPRAAAREESPREAPSCGGNRLCSAGWAPFFFFFFPNRSVYLNVYFITSLQHIIPTLPRAEFCHLFLILIFCNDSLKSLSL